MTVLFCRLLAIAAMLLMSFGMSQSTAAAMPGHSSTTAAQGHCDDNPSDGSSKARMAMHCAAACTALPSQPPEVVASPDDIVAVQAAAPAPYLLGTSIPPAIPPPRGS